MRALSRGLALVLAVVLATALASAPAHAQRAGVDSKAAAEALFDHAKQLHAAGRYAEACPKFAESQKLDAGVGTLLYLADCYEKIGQTASAWAGFREAAAAAKNANQEEREKIARDRAAALEPQLSRLTITVEPGADDVEVTRNGVPVGKPLWGTAIPVDPGPHSITASAKGKKTWVGRIDVARNGASVTLRIPHLLDAPPDPGHDAGVDGAGTRGAGQRAAGLVLGGVGLAGVVLGAVFGAQAIAKDGEADDNCRADDATLCTQRGVDLADDASAAATISTIAFAAGGAALVAGGVLFFTASRGTPAGTGGGRRAPASASLRVSPALGPRIGGVRISGAF